MTSWMNLVQLEDSLQITDCVIYREVTHRGDVEELQRDLERMLEWTRNWQLPSNIQKCKVMVITNKRTTMGFKYCLGPLLFIVVINDIMVELSSTGGLFADY